MPCYSNYSVLKVSSKGRLRSLTLPSVCPHHDLFLASARPLHCGTTSHATDQATPVGSSNPAFDTVSLLVIPLNWVMVVKMTKGRHLPGGRSWVIKEFFRWGWMFSISWNNLAHGFVITTTNWGDFHAFQTQVPVWWIDRDCSQSGCWTSNFTGQIWSTV